VIGLGTLKRILMSTKKYLIRIEFRYRGVSQAYWDSSLNSKTITIGVFDNLDKAIDAGNKEMEVLERHFKLNPNWGKKERFSKNGGPFNEPKMLIGNLAYLQTPFSFFATIETLHYEDLESTIKDILISVKDYNSTKTTKNN